MKLIDSLFKFPIVMIDGEKEEERESIARVTGSDSPDPDIIIGEAECPYYDFVCISDRWIPTTDSYNKALDSDFEACFVTFGSSGSYVVPWSKQKFKKELKNFIDKHGEDIPHNEG